MSVVSASMANEPLSTYKILVLGDSNVGKTCIVHRFCDESFYDTYMSTIGVDFKQKIIDLDGVPVKLQIWDTAGQERFRTLTTAYYRGAMGILLMYDVTNIDSFYNLSYWLRNIQENANPDVIKVLAGNKSDAIAQRAVRTEDGEQLSHDFEIPFFEISCKANVNIGEVFLTLARNIRIQRESRLFQGLAISVESYYKKQRNFPSEEPLQYCFGHLNDVDDIETFNINQPKTQMPLDVWKSCSSC